MLGTQLLRGAENEFRIREWGKRNAYHLSHWSGSYQSTGQGVSKKHNSKNTVGDLCLSPSWRKKQTPQSHCGMPNPTFSQGQLQALFLLQETSCMQGGYCCSLLHLTEASSRASSSSKASINSSAHYQWPLKGLSRN